MHKTTFRNKSIRSRANSKQKEIKKYIVSETLSNLLEVLSKASVPTVIISGCLLFAYLDHMNLRYLLQPSLSNVGGLIALFISLSLLMIAIAGVLLAAPWMISSTHDFFTLKLTPKNHNRWLKSIMWSLYAFIIFPASYAALIPDPFGPGIFILALYLINFIIIATLFSARRTSLAESIERPLSAFAITITQLALTIPLIFIYRIADSFERLPLLNWYVGIAWFAYSAFVGISAVHSHEISNGNKGLTTQVKRFWLALAVVTMLALLAIAPVWLLKGAARAAGIYDDTPAWFAIEKDLLLPHSTSLLAWKTKRVCSQSDKFSYLYGTVVYQFGGSITVICPVGITPDIGPKNRCLTFQDQKITRATPCTEDSRKK